MQDMPGTFPPHSMDNNTDVAPLTLAEAIYARRSEYVQADSVRVKVGTWNAGAQKHTEDDVASWFIDAEGVDKKMGELSVKDEDARLHKRDEIGIYVLNLQEIVDITAVTEALRPYADPSVARKWKDALQPALPEGYTLVAEQQMLGLLLLVYASPSIAQSVRGVSVASVGTGLGGVMGNKGAVAARIIIGESTRILFINSHLAAGADKAAVERRNWDAAQITSRTKFSPLADLADTERGTGEHIGSEDFAFWSGDLNYRLEGIPGDDVRRLFTLHAQNKFDVDSQSNDGKAELNHKSSQGRSSEDSTSTTRKSIESSVPASVSSNDTSTTVEEAIPADEDPSSLLTTLKSLLPHDELHQQMKSRKAFHDGWREGPITFPPTYKYDVGSVGSFDSSDKKRAPSFCDRILYRTKEHIASYERTTLEEGKARKKDAEMKAHGADLAAEDEGILYDYDPDNDGDEDQDDEEHADNDHEHNEQLDDVLTQENYTTYQHILSSDHKPMSAEFVLRYGSIDAAQRARVHSEIVKKFDEAENDSRPRVTVIADKHGSKSAEDGVTFDEVRWAQAKQRTVTVANTGHTPANFSLIGRPTGPGQEAGIAPDWLTLRLDGELLDSHAKDSKLITLEPGDAVNLVLEIDIQDLKLTHALNNGSARLDDVLVLRIKEGRDHFASVQADWQTTFLCHSIDELVRVPEGGIRHLQKLEGGAAPTMIPLDAPVCVSAPRELFRLIESIETVCSQVVAEWELLAESGTEAPWDDDAGWPFSKRSWATPDADRHAVLSSICDAIDCNLDIKESFPADTPPEARLYLLSEMLLIFLQSITDGLISVDTSKQLNSHFAQVEKTKQKPSIDTERNAVQEILMHAGAAHNISFVLLTTMLQRIKRELDTTERSRQEPSTSSEEKHGTLRRMTGLVKAPKQRHRHTGDIVQAYADIFSAAAVQPSIDGADATKMLSSKRKADIFKLFLDNDEPT